MELSSLRNEGRNDFLATSSDLTNLPLYQCLDKYAILFFNLSGIFTSSFSFLSIWCNWSLFLISNLFAFYIFIGIVGLFLNYFFTSDEWDPHVLFCCGFMTQGISLCFIFAYAQNRLTKNARKVDLFVFPKALKIAFFTFLAFESTEIPMIIYSFVIYHDPVSDIFGIICFFGTTGCCLLLSVYLLFLIVDSHVCLTLISNLIDQELITIDQYDLVKTEVEKRVSEGQMVSNIVMGAALINVVIVLVLFIISETILSQLFFILLLLAAISKEIGVVLLGFWYVALVNEKSQQLTSHLSTKALKLSDPELSLTHLKVFSTACANPMVFPLVGMTFTRKDVIIRLLIWLVGLFIGITRQHF